MIATGLSEVEILTGRSSDRIESNDESEVEDAIWDSIHLHNTTLDCILYENAPSLMVLHRCGRCTLGWSPRMWQRECPAGFAVEELQTPLVEGEPDRRVGARVAARSHADDECGRVQTSVNEGNIAGGLHNNRRVPGWHEGRVRSAARQRRGGRRARFSACR